MPIDRFQISSGPSKDHVEKELRTWSGGTGMIMSNPATIYFQKRRILGLQESHF